MNVRGITLNNFLSQLSSQILEMLSKIIVSVRESKILTAKKKILGYTHKANLRTQLHKCQHNRQQIQWFLKFIFQLSKLSFVNIHFSSPILRLLAFHAVATECDSWVLTTAS